MTENIAKAIAVALVLNVGAVFFGLHFVAVVIKEAGRDV
jgi:hypothetical protein